MLEKFNLVVTILGTITVVILCMIFHEDLFRLALFCSIAIAVYFAIGSVAQSYLNNQVFFEPVDGDFDEEALGIDEMVYALDYEEPMDAEPDIDESILDEDGFEVAAFEEGRGFEDYKPDDDGFEELAIPTLPREEELLS